VACVRPRRYCDLPWSNYVYQI